MKIISWNINGLRAVYKKGFLDWFRKENADIVCLQEIKANVSQIPVDLRNIPGYFCYFNPSFVKAGHAGVAVFSKIKPKKIEQGIGLAEFDRQGRVLKLSYDNFALYNFYMVNGGRSEADMEFKLRAYDFICRQLKKNQVAFGGSQVLVGDFNVAHKEIDLARPKENEKKHGFTLPERQKIDKLLELGFVDSFRKFHKEGGHYTWWRPFANARERNIGWRIDYCFVSQGLADKLKDAFIKPQIMGSDHCPVGVDINI